MDDKLSEYAKLCARIKADEARKKVLQAEIEAELGNEGEVEKEFGTFKMVTRASWEYSDQLKEAEEDIKVRKTDEQESGIAVQSLNYNLRFNPAKAQ